MHLTTKNGKTLYQNIHSIINMCKLLAKNVIKYSFNINRVEKYIFEGVIKFIKIVVQIIKENTPMQLLTVKITKINVGRPASTTSTAILKNRIFA